MRTRHVIIGASAAGISAALAMRAAGHPGEIVVCDSSTYEPYERPPLSKQLFGATAALRPILPVAELAEQDIELRLGTRVIALDRSRRRVEIDGGTRLGADRVVLATGSRARRLAVPGAGLHGVFTLRDADDAMLIGERLAGGGPLVVIGGGYVGLELAALARQHDIEVHVVEAAPQPLVPSLGSAIAQRLVRMHIDRGTRFHLADSVARLRGGPEVEQVLLDSGTLLPARTVVIGVGAVPNDELARDAGLATRDGIVVDEHGRSSDEWIRAAGDVAVRPSPWLAAPARLEHWDSAQKHGAAVGASAVGALAVDHAVPYVWSDQFGTTLQMFGRMRPGDELVLRRSEQAEAFVAFWLRDGRVAAVAGIGEPRAVRCGRTLIESGTPVTADILRDPATDLRRLGTRKPGTS